MKPYIMEIPKLQKREVKTIKSNYLTDEFSEELNQYLKDGWAILSSACATCVFFDRDLVIHRHSYTALIYKEFYE